MLPELIELLKDEESGVRVAALEVLVDLASFWPESCLTKIKPLLQKFCDNVTKANDLVMLEGLARLLGRLCHEFKGTCINS